MNQVLENILTRRSTRAFKNEQLKDEEVEVIVKAGLHAPSGMNRQTWQFTVVQNPETIEELAKVIRKLLNKNESYNFYGAPTLVMVSNDIDNTNGLADSSCALENMFLMANSLNIGSCWINQLKTICDNEEVRCILNSLEIPQNHIVWGIAALGYKATENNKENKITGVVKYFK
ncbi:Nitroreductase [Clostridium cavendishii DSM 21758]|uniref:Nitroreductase n=1 Tax=Clostridium cavendishii DSM 21758 TaxID=1121302 RepID=A0A1M6CXY2_9CLOT|nr:nitroreductase [Clostridium cavendishii]SHI65578.1 Nitroreductase [Clostridium cavendishii DSM 21758]